MKNLSFQTIRRRNLNDMKVGTYEGFHLSVTYPIIPINGHTIREYGERKDNVLCMVVIISLRFPPAHRLVITQVMYSTGGSGK